MGFFDRLFGKKQQNSHNPGASGDDGFDMENEVGVENDELGEEIASTASLPIQGPPLFVRAAEMQRAYWTHDAQEQLDLESRGMDRLSWRERLRLLHLLCMQCLQAEPLRGVAKQKCKVLSKVLLGPESPFRPQTAMIWKGDPASAEWSEEPDLQGELVNPSLTHLGCLEIYRLDPANQPTRIDFVGFDELIGVKIAAPGLIRIAKLFYNDGKGELVLVPILYGTTWSIGSEADRSGQLTRFVAHLEDEATESSAVSGIGIGQQDLALRDADGGMTLFGLGAVAEVAFPLDMRDPGFDAKARLRGVDAAEARRKLEDNNL